MARKRGLKDAAADPLAKKEIYAVQEKKEQKTGRPSCFKIAVTFCVGLLAGVLASRFLKI
jgi:F0F1-type ATP synthase assembly protein I